VSDLRRVLSWGLLASLLAFLAPGRVNGQGPTIDNNGPGAPGGQSSSLGPIPGAGSVPFLNPGGGGQVLGGRPGASVPRVPTSISTPGGTTMASPNASITPVQAAAPAATPIYGSLAIPNIVDDEGEPGGVSLDEAVERLVRENLDLRGKFMEIPQAKADILTASLRANPIFYADTQLVPYGQYSNARPGGQTQYDVNISYPLDLTRKRKYRTIVACRAEKVLEAQYQDAVRQQIDNLYTAYVDVLAARGAVRFSEKGVEGLDDVYKSTLALFQKGEKPKTDVNRVKIQLDTARVGLVNNQEALRRARRALGVMLNIPANQAENMEFRGTIRDTYPPPPPIDELSQMALSSRPDITSYRLGISRAQADVRLAKANILPDVYLLYQPYTFQDNTYQGLKSPTSWAVGLTVPMPVYNRNQGVIQRSKLNVTQTMIQTTALEQSVLTDVRQAEQAYIVTLAAVRQNEETVLPDAQTVLADSQRLFKQGELDVIGYLTEVRLFNDIARQYLDSLVAHRRSMLSLNTSLGRRILP
jgi:cobalt-zinc-cadmium efflux system outer membrane protein